MQSLQLCSGREGKKTRTDRANKPTRENRDKGETVAISRSVVKGPVNEAQQLAIGVTRESGDRGFKTVFSKKLQQVYKAKGPRRYDITASRHPVVELLQPIARVPAIGSRLQTDSKQECDLLGCCALHRSVGGRGDTRIQFAAIGWSFGL